jgi:2-succinyl-6-hydroxy-2,4-cyclohexadiene-1-carboxylate synthase
MSIALAMHCWGEGSEPAVLLHGFTGTGAAFDHLRPLLGGALRVAALDLPGHGNSPLALNGGSAWETALDSIADAIDRAHGGPAHLVGYSMGARLALGVALRHPAAVRSLVLESGTAGVRGEGDRRAGGATDRGPLGGEAARAERLALDGALADLLDREGVAAFVARWEENDVLAGLRKLPPALAADLRARRLAQSAAGLGWALRQLGQASQPDLWPELRGLRARTLLLHGSRDDKFRAYAERMALRIPDATLHEVRGAGHTPHLEKPQAFAAALLAFIAPAARAGDISIAASTGSSP